VVPWHRIVPTWDPSKSAAPREGVDARHRMKRTCEPELLDGLPFDHPDAVHSRRDLRIVNRFMRSLRWFGRTLPGLVRPGEPVLEIGAGTGELGSHLIARKVAVDGLDLCPKPPRWPAGRQWHQADIRTFGGYGEYPVVIGNLIFHQFSDADLAALGRAIGPGTRLVVASEPLRSRLSQRMMAAVAPLLGANHVTLHDARVSIAAGFLGLELPVALGMDPALWEITCSSALPGIYRMVAIRRA